MNARKSGPVAVTFSLAALALPSAILAQAVVVEPYSQGENRQGYKEISGAWADVAEASTAEDIKAPGSRELQQPAPGSPAVVEFAPALEAGRDVQVAFAWPALANAKGLTLQLVGTDQAWPVIMAPDKANQWNAIGAFRVAEGQKPVFRLTTTEFLSPLEEGRALEVVIGGVRFDPIPELPSDPFAGPGSIDDPFATANEVVARTDDMFATVQNPFGNEPLPPSPFVDDAAAPAPAAAGTPAPLQDPFGTTTEGIASPFSEAPGTTPTTSSPFETSGMDSGIVPDGLASGTLASPVDPFADSTTPDPFAVSGESPFAGPGAVTDPFAATPAPTNDPFARSGEVASFPGVSETPAPPDPFGAAPGGPGAPPPFAGMNQPPAVAPAPGTPGDLPQPVYREAQDRYLAADLIRGQQSARQDTPLFQAAEQPTAVSTPAVAGEVKWVASLSAAKEEAKKRNCPIMLIFLSDNAESQLFAQNFLSDKKISDLINRAVPVQVLFAGDEPLVAQYAVPRAPYGVILNKHGFTQGHVRMNRSKDRIEEDLQKMLK